MNRNDFWESFHKLNDKFDAASDMVREKIRHFTNFSYGPFYRNWQVADLAQKYEDAFLNLLEDYLANESLENIEDSKLFAEFKKVQDVIAEDMKKNPEKYYNGDIPW